MKKSVAEIFDLAPTGLDGAPRPLAEFRGRVLLIVNTASACGFTPQMKAFEELHRAHEGRGLAVLGFPSNDFNQEPLGSDGLATEFCERFAVSFPLFGPTRVRGKDKHPLFATLTAASGGLLGREILWNFEKFLIDHEGVLVDRWRSLTKPDGRAITGAVEQALVRRTSAPA
jgi:glutathione peroxidase